MRKERQMEKGETGRRLLCYDWIRIVAIILVVLVHVSAYVVLQYPDGREFAVGNVFNGLSRAGVPLFVLLSGSLLLDENKNFDTKTFYKKSLLFMVLLTIGWLFFYGLFYFAILPALKGEAIAANAFTNYILTFEGSDYPHLWYMFMVIGMYLIIPVLRLFVKRENKNYVKGIIIACILVQVCTSSLDVFTRNCAVSVSDFVGKFHMESVTGYIVYLFIGWYLANYRFTRKERITLYSLSLIAVIGSILAVQFCISDISNIRVYVYGALSLPTLFYGCAVFVLIQTLCDGRATSRIAAICSDYSFGIYMIHIVYLELLTQWLLPYSRFGIRSALLYIVLMMVLVIGLSFLTVYAVSHIKYVRKIFYLK